KDEETRKNTLQTLSHSEEMQQKILLCSPLSPQIKIRKNQPSPAHESPQRKSCVWSGWYSAGTPRPNATGGWVDPRGAGYDPQASLRSPASGLASCPVVHASGTGPGWAGA